MINAKLTKEQAIANHNKMWRWIAVEILKKRRKVEKEEYFTEHSITNTPRNKCYCCEYVAMNCSNCIIEWGGKYGSCCDKDYYDDNHGLYALWRDEADFVNAAILAKQISELPERK